MEIEPFKSQTPRIFFIIGSSRSEHTCPSEMSKSFRLIEIAEDVVESEFSLGGNPDSTLTAGKDPSLAKKIEMEGWSYPRHLEGRFFSVVVHGDVAAVENLPRSLSDWLQL